MQDFLTWLNTLTPAVSIVALIVLAIYTVDTARIRRAAVIQARAQLQPCLVLLGVPRAHDEQLVDTAFAPAASSEVRVPVTMVNIGVGPAHSIAFQFKNADDAKAHVWRFTHPQLPPGHSHEVPLGRGTLKNGNWIFEARYRSLADAAFTSRQGLCDGQLQDFRLLPHHLSESLRSRLCKRFCRQA